jgi:DNA-binding PadR family transcriptional regulator
MKQKPETLGREEFVLLVLGLTNGAELSPVQLQKLFFLLDKNIGSSIGGPFFNFKPYHYGPFDKSLYQVIDKLAADGLVEITDEQPSSPRSFKITSVGIKKGKAELKRWQLPKEFVKYISSIAVFVTTLSFRDLILAIYNEYPEMKEKSIFAG